MYIKFTRTSLYYSGCAEDFLIPDNEEIKYASGEIYLSAQRRETQIQLLAWLIAQQWTIISNH